MFKMQVIQVETFLPCCRVTVIVKRLSMKACYVVLDLMPNRCSRSHEHVLTLCYAVAVFIPYVLIRFGKHETNIHT